MARSGTARRDDIARLPGGGASGTLQALVAEAHAQQGDIARRITDAMDSNRRRPAVQSKPRSYAVPNDLSEMLAERHPLRTLSDLVLPQATKAEIEEFIHEYSEIELLRAHGLEPRHKIMLVGPPGTGKTSLAEVFARELRLPFFSVRYDGLITSYLGETASKLRKLTDFVATQPCVVFFDEFDTLGKERGDKQETGEIKRVVSSLLLQLDALPTNCVVVCATNHPELLDRAVWRRFELRIEMPLPGSEEIAQWFERLRKDYGSDISNLEQNFISALSGRSFSDIESFTLDVRRKVVLARGKLTANQALLNGFAKLKPQQPALGEVYHSQTAYRADPPKRDRAKSNKGKAKVHPSEATLI
ncbi:AAA family ATPase [Bosea vaviloviae]|uniref:AAA family ATPase n=1 Tax=Bosea vaviloviae TaxID=1526658 RepID=UPI0009E90F34|nr:ATP-binding protein [Bosea vaviloviae]